jgi:integrase
MSNLRQALTDYLTMRRALGYKMDKAERLLGQFTAFAEERDETHVRTETALAWATLPSGADAIWTSRRLAEVRLFARHLRTLDPRTEVPPADLLPARGRRATPYLYTPQEIVALMRATSHLRGSHVQATYRTLIGLLAATGMRVGEAIGLDRDDFDAGSGMLTIRHGKFDKSRALPLHPTTAAALDDYLRRDDRPRPAGMPTLLISSTGKRLRYTVVQPIFHKLLHHCGIPPRSATCRPRIRSSAQLRRQHHRRRLPVGRPRLPPRDPVHLPWSCRSWRHLLVPVGRAGIAGAGRRKARAPPAR